MGRKSGHNHPYARGETTLRANREKRAGAILRVWRRVEQDYVLTLTDALRELSYSHDIPAVNLTTKIDSYIFDPRSMSRNSGEGRLTSQQAGRVTAAIGRSTVLDAKEHNLEIKNYEMMPNGRTIVGQFESRDLRLEREEIYKILGANGVNGFNKAGTRNGHRNIGSPSAVIGNFVQPVAYRDRPEMCQIIDETIEACLWDRHGSLQISLGELDFDTSRAD